METPAVCKDKKPFCQACRWHPAWPRCRAVSEINSIQLEGGWQGLLQASCIKSWSVCCRCLGVFAASRIYQKSKMQNNLYTIDFCFGHISFIIDLGGPILCIFLYPSFNFIKHFGATCFCKTDPSLKAAKPRVVSTFNE